jgi:uncharacterized protein
MRLPPVDHAGSKDQRHQPDRSVRLVVFAKAPLPGLAKTRLIPVLGVDGAAALAERMLRHTLAKAVEAKLGPVELCVSPFEHPIWAQLGLSESLLITDQGEGDLGERMARACQRSLAAHEPVILLGTDCPACDALYLRQMAFALARVDAVIAAAADGGYPAIGLTRFDDSVFQNIVWSTDSVLRETLAKFQKLQWTFEVFPEVHDIDEPEDLKHLPSDWLD